MAQLTAPSIDWSSPTTMPQSQGAIVVYTDIMEAGPPAILTNAVLVAPTFNQLLNDPGVGYPF